MLLAHKVAWRLVASYLPRSISRNVLRDKRPRWDSGKCSGQAWCLFFVLPRQRAFQLCVSATTQYQVSETDLWQQQLFHRRQPQSQVCVGTGMLWPDKWKSALVTGQEPPVMTCSTPQLRGAVALHWLHVGDVSCLLRQVRTRCQLRKYSQVVAW